MKLVSTRNKVNYKPDIFLKSYSILVGTLLNMIY
jgi:hypothetical protein